MNPEDPVNPVQKKRQKKPHISPFSRRIGVMISFDIIAGRTKRAPAWMQKSGLEWCYRIYQEPRRMWKRYAETNPVFVGMVVKEYVKRMAQRA